MIYLDNGATSFYKPSEVSKAMLHAMRTCANPGRGGYQASMEAAKVVYECREMVADFFDCDLEQVIFTSNCTHGLNIAIRSMVRPGSRVVVSGFEHNAVMRPLYELKADILVAGRKLFDHADTLSMFEGYLRQGVDLVVTTHVSNVFGYILPIEQISELCKKYNVPLILDAAQSAGSLPISFKKLGVSFIAMPGHKGLLGPQGTGILLCDDVAKPLIYGGTGSNSIAKTMPENLPERLEAGTLNVPGIAGLHAGIVWLKKKEISTIESRKIKECRYCVAKLKGMGIAVFSGEHQSGTFSFIPPDGDCENIAYRLARRSIAVRSGLHCAPLAHESAGTLHTGTVRVSFGIDSHRMQSNMFVETVKQLI